MTRFHDCKTSRCEFDPKGKKWPVDAAGRVIYTAFVVFDNDAGIMVTSEAAKTRTPKVDP